VPRVRDRLADAEVPLRVYQRLQSPGIIDWVALQRVINESARRNNEKAALSCRRLSGSNATAFRGDLSTPAPGNCGDE